MLRRFRHLIVGPVVIAWLLLTAASVVLGTTIWKRLAHGLDASADASQLRESLDEVFSLLQGAEAGQRGFLLTGNQAYLEPCKLAEAALPGAFSRLAEIAMRDHALQTALLELRGLSELKMSDINESIKIRREKGLAPAVSFVSTGKGKADMDRIREVVGQMKLQRAGILSSADETIRRHVELGYSMTLVAGSLGIGAGLFGLYLVRIGYLQDKSRRELLEAKLRAEKTVVEKSAYLADMSHEIRTPMNAILGFSELLETGSLNPKQAHYIRSIRQSGASLLQLINDILDLSKIEAGKLELSLEPTDVRELCGFLRTLFAEQATAKSLRLEFETDAVPRALMLDRLRLRQALVNLVGNAVKFTDQGRVGVRMSWRAREEDRSRGALLIDVEDTGRGISPEHQDDIFKPFVQSHVRQGTESEGTGLGLAIVLRLAEIMGGTVTLESALGRGSAFHLRLADISVSSRLPVTDMAEPDRAVDFNNLAPATLLIVDDNEANRDLLTGIFEGSHHQLRVASNGDEALRIIDQTKPDIVLLDIRMPGMDGCMVLEAIRKRAGLELLPVIAVTASSKGSDEKKLRHRFSGYLRKPFPQQALYRELAQFLPKTPQKNESVDETPNDGTAGGPLAEPEQTEQWEALRAELRILQETEWLALRDSLAINETAGFARKLKTLGERARCAPVTRYAETLALDAEAYAVHDLEWRLAEFPALLQSIEPTPARSA